MYFRYFEIFLIQPRKKYAQNFTKLKSQLKIKLEPTTIRGGFVSSTAPT